MPCPTCAATLPAGAKFCPECGTRVADAVPAAVAAPALPGSAAAPAPAAVRAPASRSASEPRFERRLLTVLFADLVGFTAASDGADPEDVRARVQPFHALVREAVAATHGVVARVVGDGVMAVWGYPLAREDDARRALEAALRIRDGLPAAGNDLQARIGVNTGEAVVAFGSEDEDADDAMGDAVNVAARLASVAASAAPVALLLTGRPEVLDQHAFANAVDETITLAPLGGDALDGVVASIAPDLGLRQAERAEIIERGGGNPLFTLELVRLRSQQRATGNPDGAALPETVQAVIAARLDVLPLEARSVAQDAAVIGAAFWAGALQAVAPRGPGLDDALAERLPLELIQQVGYHAAGLGDHEAAARALEAAGDRFSGWDFLPEATHARRWLAAVELALGRQEEALARLEEVRAVWKKLGAALPLRRLERLLASASRA